MIKEYAVIFQRSNDNWSAYSPDVEGCIAMGKTREEAERNIKEALSFHIESLKEIGRSVPEPTTEVGRVTIAA